MKKHNLIPDFYLKFRNLNATQAQRFFDNRIKKWEEHWNEDIDEVRAKYGVQPARYDVAEIERLSKKRH